MSRSYLRLDPEFADRKRDYPDGPYRALIDVLCAAEYEPKRGQFRSIAILRAVMGRSARHLPYLFAKRDIVLTADDRIQVVGWDEWQEGNWQVAERMRLVKNARAERRGEVPDAPRVVEDRTPAATRTANWRLRSKVFERDAYTCRYCGAADYPREWLVLEHVIPDGPATEENLVTACRPCNKLKGPRTPEQAGMVLLPVTRHGDTSHPFPSDAPQSSEPLAVGGKPLAVAVGNAPSTARPPITEVIDYIEERTGRPYSFPNGSKVHETLSADVRDLGAEPVLTAMRLDPTAHPDIAQLVFNAARILHPIGAEKSKAKGLGPTHEEARNAFARE